MQIIKLLAFLQVLTLSIHGKPAIRTKIDYDNVFSVNSDILAIFLSCSSPKVFETAIGSFLYFNTHPLRKIIILHCQLDSFQTIRQFYSVLPEDAGKYKSEIELLPTQQNEQQMMSALQKLLFQIAEVKGINYVYLSDTRWQTQKGYGFIEQAKEILQYAKENSIKISQVVTNYPYWRATARLDPLQWTQNGTAFHRIRAFNNDVFHHFTLSPSVFDYKVVFEQLYYRNLTQICQFYKCSTLSKKSMAEYDKCCVWALGQQLSIKDYTMAYLNDGTSTPNCVHIDQ